MTGYRVVLNSAGAWLVSLPTKRVNRRSQGNVERKKGKGISFTKGPWGRVAPGSPAVRRIE